jgi:acetolactate synthase-1/2/3 large subunit
MKLTGGEALVQQLAQEGATHVFGIPGVQLDWAVEALRKAENQIRFVVPRHEQATSYMADGFARTTGRPGVCMVVPGPGVLNAAAGLATAFACSSPVLCVAGHIHSDSIGRGYGALHEIKDQGAVLDQVTKWRGRADTPEDVPGLVRRAYAQMRSGRPAPVAVEVPYNVLAARGDVELAQTPAGEDGRLQPDQAQVKRLAAVLAAATFPVIYVGGGVLSTRGGAALQRLAEKIGAPVVMSENGRGAISDRHPLAFSTLAGRALLAHADVLVVAGSRFMETRGPFPAWDKQDTKYIYINTDREAGIEPRVPGMVLTADAGLAMAALADELPASAPAHRRRLDPVRAHQLRAWAQAKIDAIEPQASYIRALRAAIPEDGIFVNELTQVGYFARVAYPVYGPGTLIGPGYQGTLGYGFPTGLGAAVGNPGRVVVSITGDGGFGWTLQELATASKYKLDHITVVFADGHFSNVRGLQEEQFGQAYCSDLNNPDFVTMARAFGVSATQVRDAKGLECALGDAIRGGGPHLIEVAVGRMPSPWGLLRLKAPGAAGAGGDAMPSPFPDAGA